MKSLATLLLLVAAQWPGSALAQTTPEVRKISFEGAESFGEELLRAAIISDQTHCTLFVFCLDRRYVDEIGLRGDLVRLRMFYYQRGFREAKIRLDTLAADDGLDLRFGIEEGAPVRIASVDVTFAEQLPPEPRIFRVMSEPLPLAPGRPFSLIEYETARDTLSARLANLGFARAEVLANYTIPRDSQYNAHIAFEIVPAERLRFGPITVQGTQHVSPSVVHRMLSFGEGDYYSYAQLLNSQRNLFGLDTFRHIEIRADVNATTDTIVPVIVQVNEGNLQRVRFGAGLSTAEFINTEGSWASRNFLGGARRFELRARVYNVLADPLHYLPVFEDTRRPYDDVSGSLSADFSQPWFFDPLNSFNAGLYTERRSLPDIFVRTARGGYVSVTRSLQRGASATIGYRPELTELSAGGDLVFCVSFTACGPEEIQVLREPHLLSPLALSFVRDRANSLFAPTRGDIVRFDGEYAARATGSDFSYARLIAELTHYEAVTRGVVLATRVRPGWARSFAEPGAGLGLHPQKRFFGGGPNSVRGFAQFRMGPKLLTVDAVETLIAGCTADEINDGSCDPTPFVTNNESDFAVRPVGGGASLEGNVELRMPFIGEKLRAAAFVDFGQVWRESRNMKLNDVVFTPGFGFRYFSAIGPVRVDVGYNPQKGEQLEVVTTRVACPPESACSNTNELVSLGSVLWNADRSWLQRFQLHFSIGQAF